MGLEVVRNAPRRGLKRSKSGCLVCRSFKKGCTKEKRKRCDALGYECTYPEPHGDYPSVGIKIAVKRKESSSEASSASPPTIDLNQLIQSSRIHSEGNDRNDLLDSFLSLNSSVFFQPAPPNPTYSLFETDLLPQLSYSKFHSEITTKGPEFRVGLALEDLVQDALTDEASGRVVAALYSLFHFVWMKPEAINTIATQMINNRIRIARRPSLSFGCIFLSTQNRLIPSKTVFRDSSILDSIEDKLDTVIAKRHATAMDLGQLQALEMTAWRSFITGTTLEERLFDLQDYSYVSFYLYGAEAYLRLLGALIDLVSRVITPETSTVNISQLDLAKNYAFANWIWADVLRAITCVCAPTFRYVAQHGSDCSGLEPLVGTANAIIVLFADISRLAFEYNPTRQRMVPLMGNALAEAQRISQELVQVPATLLYSSEDSRMNVSQLACQEIWRLAALIHYHQAIWLASADTPIIQSLLRSILNLFKAVKLQLEVTLRGTLALPVFLASSVALTEEDRETCKGLLWDLGRGKGWQEVRGLIQLVWDTSPVVDFRDIVLQTGCQIAFF